MSFPKALIIGLGGLGSDIVCDVYTRFNNHSEHEEDRNRVRFLALDTDSNEIIARRKIMNPDDVIQTSATTDVIAGRFIDEIKDISTVESWFPTETNELRLMSINDGAGQIRTISRLAFSHAIHSGKLDRIKQVIDELLNVNVGEGNIIEVHIVTSLAGGTGAGSYLQTAYLVREHLLRNGIANPKVLGYFMLGDIFLHDPSINLSDPDKTTSILANTYACLKELNGIYSIKEGKEIEFEYGDFNPTVFNIKQENSIPYSQCFLTDFENNDGNNISSVKNYKKQIEDFLYLNAFSPTGPRTRSEAVNNIFNTIKSGETSRYASTGISKIVYPVDNLLSYFSTRRLRDNLKSTWLKIDRDFDELYKEYILDTNKGIIKQEPKLSEYFMSNVESLAQNGTGAEQAVFKSIWMSTQVIDEENLDVLGDKTDYLLQHIVQYLTRLRDKDQDIASFSQIHHSDSFTGKDVDQSNDIAQIREVEDQLDALKRETFSFIEDTKRLALEEIFTKDITSAGYYNEEIKHRINTYTLPKGKAMHPIAQRYFYYQLLEKLTDNYNHVVNQNEDKLRIISAYDIIYDIKNEKGGEDLYIETAIDAYKVYVAEDKTLMNFFSKVTGKASNLVDFKADYVSKSKRQAKVLTDFALVKLQEHVFEGLIFQIKKMIENLESLFKTIPDVMVGLENKYNALTSITNSANTSVIYVLSKDNHREDIYENSIAARDSIFFPEDMSRSIYEEIFNRTYQQINNPIHHSVDKTDNRIKWIFEDLVVDKQIAQFKDLFKDDFAGYNIIQAMRKHAALDGLNPNEFMKSCTREAERKATPFGAKYDSNAPKINAWAFHPECVEFQNLTPDDADKLFNNASEAQNNASRVSSDYFDKTEIIREDSVMILKVPENYPKFASINTDQLYSDSIEGIYARYYKKRLKEIQNNPNLPSPHLDKHWVNPALFTNLGVSDDTYKARILRAYFWGLSQGYIMPYSNHGTMVWGYNSTNNRGISFFKGINGRPLKININSLLTEGLWNNEKIVDEINLSIDKRIEESKKIWTTLRMKGKSILSVDLVKNFIDYRFKDFEDFKEKNLLSIFNGYVTENDSKNISFIVDEIINTIIILTGNKGQHTRDIVEGLLNKLLWSVQKDTIPLTKSIVKGIIESSIEKAF